MAKHFMRSTCAALIMIFAGSRASAENAYIANSQDNTVSVIDTASNTVTAIIPVGSFPESVAATPDGSKVYVANFNSNTVSVIAAATNTVIVTIATDAQPGSIAMSPDGSKVYVAGAGPNSVWVIATASDTVAATIVDSLTPYEVAVTHDGSHLYLANGVTNDATVIATATNTLSDVIPVGQYPIAVAVSPDDSKAYVSNMLDATVSVIATASNTVTATIHVDNGGGDLAVSLDGSRIYATDGLPMISVIDTVSNTETATIPVGHGVTGGAVAPDGSRLYVASAVDNTVSVIATATNAVTNTIRVGKGPLAYGPMFGPAPATSPAASLVSATLPGTRSVDLSSPATVFATMLNATANPLSDCYITLPDDAPSTLSLSYQTTSSATNAPVGLVNTPATIPAHGAQSFVLSFTSTEAATFSALALIYRCDGVAEAATTTGVNTVDLLFSATPIPDVIALAASTTPGVVPVPFSRQGAAAFAVATDNVGVDGTLTVKTDTGGATLPLAVSLCQTNSEGACMAPPSTSVSLDFAAGATPTFSFFVTASGSIPFNPGGARVFVLFLDGTGASHGSTSLAVDTD